MQPTRTTARWLHAIGIAIVLLGAPLLAGSVAAADQGDAVLRVHQRYYPGSLDPQQSAGVEFAAFLGANYEGLTRLNQHLDVVPAAAESWEFSDDGTVVTFSLREGLTYSDGSPLTAERFAEAVRRTCDPHVRGDYQHILFDVAGCQELATLYDAAEDGTPVSSEDLAAYEAARANVGVRALDDSTLQIVMTHPAPYFPAIAGMPVFYPAKQELIEQGGEDWWQDPALQIGNGPFQVAQMEPDRVVTFEANDRYWGGRPQLDRLELVYIADSEEDLIAYQAGDLDMVALEAEQLEDNAQLQTEVVRVPIAATSFLSFNLTREPFTDKKVREAFAYGFDRGTYCEQRRDGGCEAALGWIPPGLPGHVATDAYAFDPERARQALADSSYGGPEALPEISYAYWSEDRLIAEWTEWIAGQYREILGVEITLQPLKGDPLVAMMSEPETYPMMAVTGWIQDYPDPQNWLSVYWTCAASFAQDFGYCNPELDALIARADRELDREKRLALYEAAGQMLIDDVPGVFVSHGAFLYLVKPRVTGYAPTPVDASWPGQTASLLTVDVS